MGNGSCTSSGRRFYQERYNFVGICQTQRIGFVELGLPGKLLSSRTDRLVCWGCNPPDDKLLPQVDPLVCPEADAPLLTVLATPL
jgi:hypothetical protein